MPQLDGTLAGALSATLHVAMDDGLGSEQQQQRELEATRVCIVGGRAGGSRALVQLPRLPCTRFYAFLPRG